MWRVAFAILTACGARPAQPLATPPPKQRPEVARPAWKPTPSERPERPRLTLTGLVGPEKEISGDTPISQVRFRTMTNLTFSQPGPHVYGMIDDHLGLIVYGKERVETIYVFTPLITNDGDFAIGERVDDALAARLTRDRCRMATSVLSADKDVTCTLEGFELHLDGELPIPWSLTGRTIKGVAVHLQPSS